MSRFAAAISLLFAAGPVIAGPPNILLVLADDQGYGDLGCHGNPVLKTPNIDRFAGQSVECTHFYVSPVCAPTRASLMTGYYNYRTGVVDTYNGRALMRPDVPTLAQRLATAGYRTGLFGKWHLGDNYPLRPQDRGFHEVLMHRGGGIGQPSDPPGNSYFKPILEHNGKTEKFDSYCTDVFTDAAMRFIEESKSKPFFVYLAYNCPHAPLQTPESDVARYAQLDLSPAAFPTMGQPFGTPKLNATLLAKLYGMETNLDANFGRLLAKIEDLKLADNTIVIFMSDNGPQEGRYNAGLRGLKGTVYEGGIRVPFFIRWPAGGSSGGRKVQVVCAHVDIVPTLLAASNIQRLPGEEPFDGEDLLPLLRGEAKALRDRTHFFQWHRGDSPEEFRACAVRESGYKLVQAAGTKANEKYEPKFELFDIPADPYEQQGLAERRPEVVSRMKAAYERWFADVTKKGFAPVRPQLGTPHESPTRLTRQDWRGPRADRGLGYWEVNLPAAGTFDVTVTLKNVRDGSTIHVRMGDVAAQSVIAAGATTFTFRGLKIRAGDARLEAWVERDGESAGVWDVEARRTD